MNTEYRIGKAAAVMAVIAVLIIDILIQPLLTFLIVGVVVNPIIITPATGFVFWLWFKGRGVQFASKNNMITTLTAVIIEAIPVINTLPGLTLWVVRVIINTRIEDMANSQGITGKLTRKGLSNLQESGALKQGGVNRQTNKPPRQGPAPEPTNIANTQTPYAARPTNIANTADKKPTPFNLARNRR